MAWRDLNEPSQQIYKLLALKNLPLAFLLTSWLYFVCGFRKIGQLSFGFICLSAVFCPLFASAKRRALWAAVTKKTIG